MLWYVGPLFLIFFVPEFGEIELGSSIQAVRAFNEADATDMISRTSQLASDIEGTTTLLISKRDSVSGPLRNAVAQGLQVIINHAKPAGDALVSDCPVSGSEISFWG